MEIGLASDPDSPARRYTVRLHFAEVDQVRPGERVFDVLVQDKKVLANFDILKEAGGPMTAIVKEVPDVEVRDILKIELTPGGTDQTRETLLSGIEIVAPPAAKAATKP
jgi:beta-galactosidase